MVSQNEVHLKSSQERQATVFLSGERRERERRHPATSSATEGSHPDE